MDATFKLPKGEVLVKGWGNFQMELVAALAGAKPVIHCWVGEEDEAYLEGLCKALRFHMLVYTRDGGIPPSRPGGHGVVNLQGGGGSQRLGVMLGPRKSELAKAAKAWTTPGQNPGPNLGYPECCSQYYMDNYCAYANRLDCVELALRNTKGKGSLPFLLNDVFYWYSRKSDPEAATRRDAIAKLNPGLPLDTLNVIGWHPCSYRCKESLAKAKKIWRALEKVWPEQARLLGTLLRGKVVFWDWSRFAVIRDGHVAPPLAPLEEPLVRALSSGAELPGQPVVLDFA